MFNWKPPFLPHPWLELWQAVGIMAIPWLYSLYLIIIRQFKVTWLPALPGSCACLKRELDLREFGPRESRLKQPARIQKKPRKNIKDKIQLFRIDHYFAIMGNNGCIHRWVLFIKYPQCIRSKGISDDRIHSADIFSPPS